MSCHGETYEWKRFLSPNEGPESCMNDTVTALLQYGQFAVQYFLNLNADKPPCNI